MNREKQASIYERARQVMPLGVTSNFRYWGDETPIAGRAKGAYLWDADDNRYIDYRLGFGPVVLGHAHDEVDRAVMSALQDGNIFAMTTEREVRVAEKIVAMCPAVDMVRFATSGTEATMHAIRVARAYTGREKVVKFEGQYHGMHDYTLWSTYPSPESMGSRRSPIPVQASSGIPAAIRNLVITIPYNDFELTESVVNRYWHDIACIIVEPMLGNCASIDPLPGFLDHIRKLCDAHGIVFILDEVKTGFRVARGGAQEHFNIKPDLTTYAKSLGNSYPIAAFGGKREIMSIIGEGVAHGGTYTGNAIGTAAAEKVLEIIDGTDALTIVAERGKALRKGMADILEKHSLPFAFAGHPSMFGVLLTDHQPKDYRDWAASDHETYEAIGQAMIKRGAMPDPDSREPYFLSYSHSEDDIGETLNIFDDAVGEVLAG